jgi:PAS domain S-box-containing protein
MRSIKQLLAPSKFQDEEKTYQAYLLNIILLTLIAVPIPLIIYLLIWKPGEIYRTLAFITFAEIVNVTLFAMVRRGFVRQASIAHIVTLWLIFAFSSITRSGIYGIPYALGNGLVITVTGFLLGKRSAQAVTWLVIAQGGALVYAEFHGWAPKYISNDPVYTWAIAIVLFAIIVNLQTLGSNHILTALNRARISEERYRLISQVSSDYTFSTELDSEGVMRLSWVAGAFENITGFTFEEYVASGGWLAHLHPDDVEKDVQHIAILKTNKPVVAEMRAFKKNGDLSWVRVYSHPVWDEKSNTLAGIVGAVQDITQQKLGEIALTQERDLLQIFMDNIPDQAYFKDIESRFIRINKAQANFLKLSSPQESIGKTDMDFFDPELAQKFLDEEKQILISGQPVTNRVEFNPTEDGKPRWIIASKAPVRDSSGNLLGTIGISRDITQQKLTDAMLANERDILQIFMDNTPNQIYFKDTESRFVRINQVQARFLGVEAQEAIGKTDLDFQNPELAREFLAEEKRIIETGQPVINRIEYNPTREGKPLWLLTSKVAAKNELGQIIGIIGISVDITEQKLAEEREERRRIMLEKIVKLGQYVTEVQDMQSTLQRIWHTVRNELDFDRIGIFFYDAEHGLISRMLGTDFNGGINKTSGPSVQVSDWRSFKYVLEKPDGFYFTHDFTSDAPIPEGHEMYGVRDYAIVAAWAGNKPVAVITVDQFITQRAITDQQLEILRLFAGYAGLAIENSRLKDAIEHELLEQKQMEEIEQNRRVMMEKVVQLGKQVTKVSNFDTTLKRIWHGVRNGLDFDRVGIWLYVAENNTMQGSYGTDQFGKMIEEWDMKIDLEPESSFYAVLKRPDGFFFTNDYEQTILTPSNDKMKGVKYNAAVACWSGDKPMAIISVDNLITNRAITDVQVEALRLFSSYAGLSIQNSQLNDAIQNELDEKRLAEEVEQRRRQMLEKVVQLGKQVTAVSDLRTTLQKVWHIIRYDLDFDRVGLFLYNQQDNSYDGAYGTDHEGRIWEAWHVKVGVGEDTPFEKSMVFHKVLGRPNGFYVTKDYEAEFKVSSDHSMAGVKNYAVVAVWSGDKPVAIISVDQLITNRAFSEEQLEALRLFAGYAGLAIENSRLSEAVQDELDEQKQLEENEQRRRVMLEKVVQLGKRVTEVSDLRTTLRKIWSGVRYELDFDRVGLFTYSSKENAMIGAYGTDREGNIWDAWQVRFGLDDNALFHKVLSHPDGFYFSSDFETELNLPPDHDMKGVKNAALVAVWAGNKPAAIISVDQLVTNRPITEEQLEALRLFAGYAGLAISNAHLNDALEEELSQRKNFIAELEAKNAELERFTYTASHDLKSPLVTITGFLGYLEKDALAGNQERMKSSIARINSAAEKMQALLNDLLELSRIGRLMNPAEDVLFEEIVHEAIDRVRGRLDETNAVVEVQSQFPSVRCDRIRLVEVLQNLIENAIKYTKPNTTPRIEIGTNGLNENGQMVFHVRDNGMGIDPQYHERIFGLFNKLDAQSEGTGIGLSLVKRIIEVHSGRVWVESEKGMGATFYFSLPTSQPKE